MIDKIKAKATMQGSSAAAALAPPADGSSRHQGDPRQNPPGAARKKCGKMLRKMLGKHVESAWKMVDALWKCGKKMVGLTILAGHGHDGLSAIKKTSSKSLFQLAGRWHVDHNAHAKMAILAGKNNLVQCAA
jgi:hypothetical protein